MLDTPERQRSAQRSPTSTTAGLPTPGDARLRRGWLARRIFTALLVLFVAAAAVGFFGVQTRTVRSAAGGASARLEYASVNRRGVTSAWKLVVGRDRGFPKDLHVRVSLDYLDVLDVRGIHPQPQSSSTDDNMIDYTFTRPHATRFTFRIDADIDPSASPGRHRGLAIVTVGGASDLRLHFTTWVLP